MINSLQVLRRFVFEEWGGTETVVWNTAKKLQQMDNPIEILSTSALYKPGLQTVEKVNINRFKYFYPYLNMNSEKRKILDKKGGDPYSLSLYQYMIKSKNIDLIHCHTMNRIAASVRLAAKKHKIPYLVSFHGGHFDVPKTEMDEMIKPYKGTFNYGKIIDIFTGKKNYLTDADAIICVGYNEYKITQEKFPKKLVYYLPNGVDPDKFAQNTSSDFRKKFNIPKNSTMILCVSRIDYQKNQKLLIKLIEKLKNENEDAKLVLIGPVTSASYFNEMQSMIDNADLQDNVIIIKGLKADDPLLVSAYQNADVFILPSIHEPFGIVVLEAWAGGTAVIAAATGGLKKLVNNEVNGLLFDGSLDSLYINYKKIINDSVFKSNMQNSAKKEVTDTYSWKAITEKLLLYYNEVIEKYHRKG